MTYKLVTQKPVPPYWLGWLFLLFFGLLSVIFGTVFYALSKRVFLSAPRLKLSNSGVTDYTQKIGEILWSDIEKAYLRSTGHSTFICLELRNTDKYLVKTLSFARWVAPFNKRLGFTPIALNLSGLKADYTELLSTIKALAA